MGGMHHDGTPYPAGGGQVFPPVPPGLLRAPRRRGNTVFLVLVTVAAAVCAVVIAALLVFIGAPTALTVGILLAAVPVGPVVACYLWLDRYEPEPVRLLVLALAWGAFVATTVALVLEKAGEFALSPPQTVSGVLIAPAVEEATKGGFVLLLLVVRRRVLDGVLDGLVYAGMVGVGFAFTENVLYLTSAYMGGPQVGPGGLQAAASVFVVRCVLSPFAHPFFTSFLGIGAGVAVITRRRWLRVVAPAAGYLVAVAAHAGWNSSVFLLGGGTYLLMYGVVLVPVFVMFVGFAVWVRHRERQMLTRALNDCAARGFLAPAEVPWLVRLPARRDSRRYARARGGRVAARVLREYQQQAAELGFLHSRYLRGVARGDVAIRGQQILNRLAALRPYVLYPTASGAGHTGAGPDPRGWR